MITPLWRPPNSVFCKKKSRRQLHEVNEYFNVSISQGNWTHTLINVDWSTEWPSASASWLATAIIKCLNAHSSVRFTTFWIEVLLLTGIKCSNYGPVDFNAKEVGKSSRLFESTITYKRKTGWRKTRGNGTRICLSDGNWTGEPLVCESQYIACCLFLFQTEYTTTALVDNKAEMEGHWDDQSALAKLATFYFRLYC